MKQILLVEDEAEIRKMLRFFLHNAGYATLEAQDGEEGLRLALHHKPDLALVDWMMPKIDGIQLIERLRQQAVTRQMPVMMLTAKGEEADMVYGLDIGADDYVTKPFSPQALLSRIKALLRRVEKTSAKASPLVFKELTLHKALKQVECAGEALHLGPTEFRLLYFLIEHLGQVFSRQDLLKNVWGEAVVVEPRTVDVHVRRLRQTLRPYSYDIYLETLRGLGYRWVDRD